MQIEITEKEKTALSLLLGLRQKFARAKGETYSATELHKLFSELIMNINKNELKYLDTLVIAHTPAKQQDEVWGEVDQAIERSTIKRYDWNSVFGRSLTQEILFLKKSGMTVDETCEALSKDPRTLTFLDLNKTEKRKILKNLKISTHARFGENNTAKKVEEAEEDD